MKPPHPDDRAREVLRFWFEGPDGRYAGQARRRWFVKDPDFDAQIVARFGELIESALAGACDDWGRSEERACALVIVLDQFTRNAFRGTPRMYAGDAAALRTARHIVAEGWDRRYDPLHRWFAYMPFQHSESLADQRESMRLFAQLRDDPVAGAAWSWVERHHEIIERFGRFPHRNAMLGRVSTPQEIEFLREPGSAF